MCGWENDVWFSECGLIFLLVWLIILMVDLCGEFVFDFCENWGWRMILLFDYV